MKLSRKLPLAFIAASLLVAAAGSLGLVRLNHAVGEYASVIAVDYKNEQAVSSMLVDFKTQVQEWKNLLLRGKDPAQLDKYWQAFQKHEKAVGDSARELAASVPEGQARVLVQQFAQAHAAMGAAYRKGFEQFQASGFDHAAGDAAVKGQDRKPTDLLNEARARIVEDTRARVAAAGVSSADATLASAALMLLGFLGAAGGGVWLSRTITRPLDEAVAVAEQVADGFLSVQVTRGGNDETGQLLAALDRMAGNLRQMVARIRSSSDTFNAGASQIASGTVDLSARTEQQAAALEETASSMEQLAAAVRHNTESAADANALAVAASGVASQGGAVVAQVVDTMSGIHEDARRIAEIITVIDGIAFQTNILALNAAVEAARAGEQGRGFAVVAGEVRALAQRSAAAARDIKELIDDSVARVTSGTRLAGDAGSTMEQVVASVQRVKDIMAEILAATREQDAGIEQVNRAVTEMDQTTQHNAALMEEAAAAAQAMREQAHALSQSVAVFRLEAPARRALLAA